jgi:hypothetical protein
MDLNSPTLPFLTLTLAPTQSNQIRDWILQQLGQLSSSGLLILHWGHVLRVQDGCRQEQCRDTERQQDVRTLLFHES